MKGPDQQAIEFSAKELFSHAQESLDDTHRELAWIRAALIAGLFGVLAMVNYFTLDVAVRLPTALFAFAVMVAFAIMTCVHRFVNYLPPRTNLLTFVELGILQVDAIAFGLWTDNLMDSMAVYFLMIGAGLFMTTWRWVAVSVVTLLLSWASFFLVSGYALEVSRELMFLVSAMFGSFFFYYLRVRATRRLSAHQLMEQKYKEGLESALDEIETLSGLLPICAKCKSIRVENGQWTNIEQYVKERSDVEFTHSVCPSCHDELYPELQKG